MSFRKMEEKMLKTEERLEREGKPLPEVYFVSQGQKLSREAAQCVADMVSLLKLYPALYNQSLTLLAAKLDVLGYTTPFIEYIRPALPASGLEEAAEASPRKVVRGFAKYMDDKNAASNAAKKVQPVKDPSHKVVKGFSKD